MKITEIRQKFKSKEFDAQQVLEECAYIGMCPNLLNDDNGSWALVFDGYQTVNTNNGPRATAIQSQFWVPKKYWKPTIRQAILAALPIKD
jgi:hypothetical protein